MVVSGLYRNACCIPSPSLILSRQSIAVRNNLHNKQNEHENTIYQKDSFDLPHLWTSPNCFVSYQPTTVVTFTFA